MRAWLFRFGAFAANLWPYGTTDGVVPFNSERLVCTLGTLFNVVLVVLAATGVILLVLSVALDAYVWVVKKIWTLTFAMLSGGFSLLAFVALALAAGGCRPRQRGLD